MSRPQDPDFELFLRNPHAILLKYQGMIESIAYFYIEQGMFPADERDDIVQTVNLEVLNKIPSIQRHYNGSALLRTYFSAVVRNICLHMARKSAKAPVLVRMPPGIDVEGGHQPDRYSIHQAREVFDAILIQMGPALPKLLVCLKLRYRHSLTRKDIRRWWPDCGNREMNSLLARFGGEYAHLTDKEIYRLIVPFFNAAEGKVSGDDALRKWIAAKIQNILDLLHESLPGGSFDEESLRTLFEDRDSPFLLRE